MTNTGRPLVCTPDSSILCDEEGTDSSPKPSSTGTTKSCAIAPSSCCQSTWKCDVFVQYILINSWEHTLDKSMDSARNSRTFTNQVNHHPSRVIIALKCAAKTHLQPFRVHRQVTHSVIYLRNNSQLFVVQVSSRGAWEVGIHIARDRDRTTPHKVTVMKN